MRRLLTGDTAQIHGPVSALRQGRRTVINPPRGQLKTTKTRRRNGQKGREGKTDRHPCDSRSTWAVSGWAVWTVSVSLRTCSRHAFHEWRCLTQQRTRLREEEGWSRDSWAEQRGIKWKQRRGDGGGCGGEEVGRAYFKAAPAGNSRLGCSGASVSRTNRFCSKENPFGPKSVITFLPKPTLTHGYGLHDVKWNIRVCNLSKQYILFHSHVWLKHKNTLCSSERWIRQQHIIFILSKVERKCLVCINPKDKCYVLVIWDHRENISCKTRSIKLHK